MLSSISRTWARENEVRYMWPACLPTARTCRCRRTGRSQRRHPLREVGERVLRPQVAAGGLLPGEDLLGRTAAEHRLGVDGAGARLVDALQPGVEDPQAVVDVLQAHPEALVVDADRGERLV